MLDSTPSGLPVSLARKAMSSTTVSGAKVPARAITSESFGSSQYSISSWTPIRCSATTLDSIA